MFKKRYVAAAACALAMVGTANAVSVNTHGTGDFLIGPAYFIGGGLTTDLKVVNTDLEKSVVAKVVFRHPVTSQEILDFMIYLSPGDVWTGTASCLEPDAAGNCRISRIFSTDESIQLPNEETFASPENPFILDVNIDEFRLTNRLPLPNQGYFEVEMSRAMLVPNRATNIAEPGVAKADIYNSHRRLQNAPVAQDETPDVLMGTATVNAGPTLKASLPMTALAGYDNRLPLSSMTESGLPASSGYTNVEDVEEALWANNFAIPYSVGPGKASLLTFTFPTKATFRNWNFAAGAFQPGKSAVLGQYQLFNVEPRVCLIAPKVFNTSEGMVQANISPMNSACADEFGVLSFGAGNQFNINTRNFTEGWVSLQFKDAQAAAAQVRVPTDSKNTGKLGVPAIVTYLEIAPTGMQWMYAPSK